MGPPDLLAAPAGNGHIHAAAGNGHVYAAAANPTASTDEEAPAYEHSSSNRHAHNHADTDAIIHAISYTPGRDANCYENGRPPPHNRHTQRHLYAYGYPFAQPNRHTISDPHANGNGDAIGYANYANTIANAIAYKYAIGYAHWRNPLKTYPYNYNTA